MAAWLCRRHTEATLSELAGRLGQSRADSVPSLVRRMEARRSADLGVREDAEGIERLLYAGTGARTRVPRKLPPVVVRKPGNNHIT